MKSSVALCGGPLICPATISLPANAPLRFSLTNASSNTAGAGHELSVVPVCEDDKRVLSAKSEELREQAPHIHAWADAVVSHPAYSNEKVSMPIRIRLNLLTRLFHLCCYSHGGVS
jgi:hypothetical protein